MSDAAAVMLERQRCADIARTVMREHIGAGNEHLAHGNVATALVYSRQAQTASEIERLITGVERCLKTPCMSMP